MEETARSDSPATAPSAAPAEPITPTPSAPTPAAAVPAANSSARRTAANRRNARKSTGPRTRQGKRRAALNSVKYGRYGEWTRSHVESMWRDSVDLGEDPDEYARIVAGLIKSHAPANAAQLMLVGDIASLRWQRRRAERAQGALLVRSLERLEMSRAKLALEAERHVSSDARRAELLEKGLRQTKDCPSKFVQLLRFFDYLKDALKEHRFGEVEAALRMIYGADLTWRGLGIQDGFEGLAQMDSEGIEKSDEYKALRLALEEEICDVTEEYRLYLLEQVEITPAMRQECLAPADTNQWRLLLRQQWSVDRQMERKTRLLLAMQKVDREVEEQQLEQVRQMTEQASERRSRKKH